MISSEKPKKEGTNSDSIIGRPIKIGNLEIAQHDFPEYMNWDDSKKACADLGKGWRLPTKDELNQLYINKAAIGGFANSGYWSSTEVDVLYAWFQFFDIGFQSNLKLYFTASVRAIRTF